MDSGLEGRLVLGLWGTVEYTEDWHWVCSGLNSIRRTGSGSILDFRYYVGLVLGL